MNKVSLCIAAAAGGLSGCLQINYEKPNIIFFLVDDMGWQETSVPFWKEKTVLNERYQTPNMEILASQGMKFTQAYACPLSSPTRVSLMTGMNAARHGVTNWTLSKNVSPDQNHRILEIPAWNVNGISAVQGIENTRYVKTLPMFLKEAGYTTIHAGKAHWGAKGTPGENPLYLGFDVNIAGHAAGGPGSYYGKYNYSAKWRVDDLRWDVPGLEKYHGKDIYLNEALTIEALSEMEKAVKKGSPFYLYMSHYAVHAPWEKDDRFYQKYIDLGLTDFEATLASMIESMDKSLGDIMEKVKQLGIEKNTVVIFMSDNGAPSQCPQNLPLRGHKIDPYEGGIRDPMIVKWPGVVKAGTECNEPLIIEDFFPSILEMAGMKKYDQVGGKIDGLSFVPMLKGERVNTSERSFFWHFPHNYGSEPYSVIRKGDWKLIYWYLDGKIELYNIPDDISESNDLSSSNPVLTEKLAIELGNYLKSVGSKSPLDKATKISRPFPGDPWPEPMQAQITTAGSFADHYEYSGVTVSEPGYVIWGCSPIAGPDNKIHLFVERWPGSKVEPGWRSQSEIAHYIGNSPEGPFAYSDVALKGTGKNTWDKTSVHNPAIHKDGDKYVLLYIGNNNPNQPPHPSNQCIGMAVSESLYGPWKRVGDDGKILAPPDDPAYWNYKSPNGVNNPAFLQHPDGRFFLYFKSAGGKMGLAISDQLTGPYHQFPDPVTDNDQAVEDGYAFIYNNKICLLTTDNHGIIEKGGGILWKSDDGIHFSDKEQGFHLPEIYLGKERLKNAVNHYAGNIIKFERPQVLLLNNKPAYLYVTSGYNFFGGVSPVNYILKFKD